MSIKLSGKAGDDIEHELGTILHASAVAFTLAEQLYTDVGHTEANTSHDVADLCDTAYNNLYRIIFPGDSKEAPKSSAIEDPVVIAAKRYEAAEAVLNAWTGDEGPEHDAASDEYHAALDAFMEVPVTSFVGALTKLRAIIKRGDIENDPIEATLLKTALDYLDGKALATAN